MWKIVLTSFTVMFLAEIGDKTQLMALSLAGKHRAPWAVFAGCALAMLTATGLAILVGNYLPSLLGEKVMRYISGGLFVLFGVLILLGK